MEERQQASPRMLNNENDSRKGVCTHVEDIYLPSFKVVKFFSASQAFRALGCALRRSAHSCVLGFDLLIDSGLFLRCELATLGLPACRGLRSVPLGTYTALPGRGVRAPPQRPLTTLFGGFLAPQAAIEVPSGVKTPPKRVSSCTHCFAEAGSAGRRCAGSPLRLIPRWGVLCAAYISTGIVRGVCTPQLG